MALPIIAGKQVLLSETLLLRDEEEGLVSVELGDKVLKISLKFRAAVGEVRSSWEADGDVLRMIFTGFKFALGVAQSAPQEIAKIDGVPIYFDIAHHRIGESNLVHFFLLKGGPSA